MKFSELLEHAQTCIKTFNPVIMSLDSHADEYIAAVSQNSSSAEIKLKTGLFVYSSKIPTKKCL